MAGNCEEDMERFRALGKSAFVLGYTGEVGKCLVQALNEHKIFKKVVLVGRREVPLDVGPEFEQKVVDFEKLGDYKDAFVGTDVGFCCIGTTSAKAGSSAAFVRVDKDYVVMSAEIAKAQGCQQFHLVTARGSNAKSRFLYMRTKGEVENALMDVNFDRLCIYRPAFLLCDRQERRILESVAKVLMKPMQFFWPTEASVPTEMVAMAMVNNTVGPSKDTATEIIENKEIHSIAGMTTGSKGSGTADGKK